jgi:hypothetical protein
LAKQTSDGLAKMFGVHYDVGDLIPQLEQGRQEKESAKTGRQAEKAALFTAALRFDLRAIMRLLKLQRRNTPTPKLSIMRRKRTNPVQFQDMPSTIATTTAGAGNTTLVLF